MGDGWGSHLADDFGDGVPVVDAMVVGLWGALWWGPVGQGGGWPLPVRRAVASLLGLSVVHKMSQLQPRVRAPLPPAQFQIDSKKTNKQINK